MKMPLKYDTRFNRESTPLLYRIALLAGFLGLLWALVEVWG